MCYHHGGDAPQVKAKAQRRLQQAADALVQRLLGFALDGNVTDPVELQASATPWSARGSAPSRPWQLRLSRVVFVMCPGGGLSCSP